MLYQVSSVTDKIEAIKLSNAADVSEVTFERSNVSISVLNFSCNLIIFVVFPLGVQQHYFSQLR